MKCIDCQKGNLVLKDEVTYVYHYHIRDDGAVKWKEDGEYTPYLFFDREQKSFKQIVQCSHCEKAYDFDIKKDFDNEMVILKGAIHSEGNISKEPFV